MGVETAQLLCGRGVKLLAMGEMGIGNTTTSAAVLSVLLERSPAEMTGRGAGLSDEGLARKVKAIETALARHQPDKSDTLDVLSKVGGFDLAGLCGLVLGAAYCRVPVLLDGLISCAGGAAGREPLPRRRGTIFWPATSRRSPPGGRYSTPWASSPSCRPGCAWARAPAPWP